MYTTTALVFLCTLFCLVIRTDSRPGGRVHTRKHGLSARRRLAERARRYALMKCTPRELMLVTGGDKTAAAPGPPMFQ